jgi:hypothetical protein
VAAGGTTMVRSSRPGPTGSAGATGCSHEDVSSQPRPGLRPGARLYRGPSLEQLALLLPWCPAATLEALQFNYNWWEHSELRAMGPVGFEPTTYGL